MPLGRWPCGGGPSLTRAVSNPVWKRRNAGRCITRIHTEADDTANQEVILGARTSHGIFEERGLVHVLVDGVAELEKERVFHVARELLEALVSGACPKQAQRKAQAIPCG